MYYTFFMCTISSKFMVVEVPTLKLMSTLTFAWIRSTSKFKSNIRGTYLRTDCNKHGENTASLQLEILDMLRCME